jgi:hypothetical protein
MRHMPFAFLIFGLAGSAHADHHILYECVDQNGNKRFTNVSAEAQGCKILTIGPIAPPKPAAPAAAPGAAAPATAAKPQAKAVATPSNFPRVDRDTQQQRDNDRRRILEQELANEQRLLDAARKELAEQEAIRLGSERNYQRVLDRLEPYRKRVKLHEDNVSNLRREISKLR